MIRRTAFALAALMFVGASGYAEPAAGDCAPDRNPLASIGDAIAGVFRRSPPCKVDASRALPEIVDTLVIGAGPGGGTVGAKLAENGQTVAILDAGSLDQTL